jgi:hypothetical protein
MHAELNPALLTRRDTKIPADGGVLVGYGYTNSDLERTGPDPSEVKWKASAKLARTQLAPGLSVYKTDAAKFTFGKSSFTHDGKTTALTVAPMPKSVRVKSEDNPRWSSSSATLTLATAAPADAIAVIVYDADSKKALLFAGLPDTHDKELSFQIFESSGHCGTPRPPETGYVSAGSKLVFAYVDAFGRLSPQSKPITAQ